MVRPLGAIGLTLTLLAGCVATDQKGVALPDSRWTPETVARLLNPPPPDMELELAEEPPPPLPRRRPLQVAALSKPANDPPVEGLVGLDFDATEKLLGVPALDEVQPPARVWAYNGSGCVLSIFFYPNVDGSSYRALTYEVKGTEDSAEFTQKCFSELIQESGGT
ncbi:MAG: hypothetical protein MI920_05165 [Kiloniellales bacterium]|nr:hypothetical protein [Kiloniellales bacterium]